MNDEEWDGPWFSGSVACVICQQPHVAVWPSCCAKLECPRCGHMNAIPEDAWTEDVEEQP